MRQKRESVLSFACHDDELPKIVRQYREKYKGISVALDQVPAILDAVHQDLLQLTEGNRRQGRKADFTSETVLRALIVMMVEGLAYRETVIRIAESEFLRSALARRRVVDLDGRPTPLVSAEDVVVLKLVAWRPKDQGDLDDLLLVVGPLDEAYLRTWAIRLDIEERLEEAWRRAGRIPPG